MNSYDLSLSLMHVLLLVHHEPYKIHIGFSKIQPEIKVKVVIDYHMSMDSHKGDEFRSSKIWQNDCCGFSVSMAHLAK